MDQRVPIMVKTNNGYKFEITRPSLKSHELLADLRITKINIENED